MKARRLIVGMLTAGMLAGCSAEQGSATNNYEPTPTASTTTAAAPELRGFAIGDGWFDKSDAEMEHQAKLAREMDATILRLDIDWGRVRPDQQGWYNWDEIDRMLRAAKKQGLFVMATLAYAPEWARDKACQENPNEEHYTCAPQDPESYGDFANEFAYHVAGTDGMEDTVTHVEVWNEQNNNKISPEKYAEMLHLAGTAVHMTLQDAKVSIGGMAPNAEDEGGSLSAATYLDHVYKALKQGGYGTGSFDAVGFHPYGYPARAGQPFAWNGMTQIEGDLAAPDTPALHPVLVAHGEGHKPLLLNEFGAPTCGSATVATPDNQQWDTFVDNKSYVDRPLQHLMLTDFFSWRAQRANIGMRLIHTLADRNSSSTEREDCFGVLDDQYKLKTDSFTLKP